MSAPNRLEPPPVMPQGINRARVPVLPDWMGLLTAGVHAIERTQRPPTDVVLDDVMWRDVAPWRRQRRAVVFEPDLMEEWLAQKPESACEALRRTWGTSPTPRTAGEARAMLRTPPCSEGRHQLVAPRAWMADLRGQMWAAACCGQCHRPHLWHIRTSREQQRTWLFYEHTLHGTPPPTRRAVSSSSVPQPGGPLTGRPAR